ncbi:MAG: hypothetical protein JWP12_3744 [Bacteroidetes bacterium]|nr:hypothetical protein [Bacteroidota bacterium]
MIKRVEPFTVYFKKTVAILLFTALNFAGFNSFGQGTNCASADPFCTGTTYTFNNNSTGTGPGMGPQAQNGPNYGCLMTQPNPAWYYMEILNPGNLDITINQTNGSGSGTDVDFICWGPFSSQSGNCGSLTSGNTVDCSYSTAATEVCNISGAATGQFYLLLLTNYANTPGVITFNQTGGAGTTNCGVLCTSPSIATAGTQTLTCTTVSVTLTGSSSTPGVTYHWTGPGGFSSNAANPSVSVAGTYTLTVTDPANPACPSTTTQAVTTNTTLPNASTGATQNLTCTTTSVNLSGNSSTGGAGYSWSGPSGFSSSSQNPAVSTVGTYTLTVTNPSNGCTATAQQTVGTNTTPPNASAGAAQNLTCAITSVSLSGNSTTGGATYSWTGPGGFSSASQNPAAGAAGTYTVTVTDPANGCTATAQQTIGSNTTPPDASTAATQNLTCTITTVNLGGNSATGGATYSWSGPGGFTDGTQNPAVTTAGTYTLTVTDPANGCTATAQQIIGTNTTPPDATAGAAQNLSCMTTSVNLSGNSATTGATYSWAGPGGFTDGTQNPAVSTAGTYTLTVTDPANSCTATAQQIVNPAAGQPDATTGAAQSLTCAVLSVNLNGSSTSTNVTYSWSGPSGFASTSQTPAATATGTYTLTVTDTITGCSSTAMQTVNSNTTPPNATAGAVQSLTCTVLSLNLNAGSGTPSVSYNWSGPGAFTSSIANPPVTAVGTYTVTVTDPANGCTATATQVINSNTVPPDAGAGAAQTLTCLAPAANLNGTSATSGATYSWAGPGGFTSSVQNPTVSSVGTYTVTVTDPVNGCTATAQQIVNPSAGAPNATAGTAQSITCITSSVSLSGSSTTGGVNYSWSGPGGFTSSVQNPSVSTAGTYTLTVTDPANGCTSVVSQVVNTNTTPPVAAAGIDQTLGCGIASIALNGAGTSTGATYSYNWTSSTGTITSGGTTLAPVVGQGTYTLTVTNSANGCTSSDVAIVSGVVTPDAAFTASPTSGLAPLPVGFVNGSTGAVGYAWTFGQGTTSALSDPTMVYNTPGNYTVTLYAVSIDGCIDSTKAIIHVDELSVLVVPNIFTPNGDGNNEVFMPVVAEGLTNFDAQVYDRWGLKMFEWNDEHSGWNGKAKNGAPAPDGTYYYIITATGQDGKKYDYKGYISLMRN